MHEAAASFFHSDGWLAGCVRGPSGPMAHWMDAYAGIPSGSNLSGSWLRDKKGGLSC